MYVSLETLQRAVRLVTDLGDLDDPAEFAQIALPGLAGLLGCDHLAYHEIEHQIALNLPGRDGPATTSQASPASAASAAWAGFSEQECALLTLMRPSLQAALYRAGSRRRDRPAGHDGDGGRDAHSGRDDGENREGREGQNGREGREGREGQNGRDDGEVWEGRGAYSGRDDGEGREGREGREGPLTGREARVMELVASGRTNVAIAHALEVSPRTIAKHLEHIYRKLGVASRAAAVARTAALAPQAAG